MAPTPPRDQESDEGPASSSPASVSLTDAPIPLHISAQLVPGQSSIESEETLKLDADASADIEADRAERHSGSQLEQHGAISEAVEDDPFLVTMKGREKELSPHHWTTSYRWALTAFSGLLALNSSFASAAPSNLIPSIIKEFNVSEELGVLQIGIFVAGYCTGPILWGPASESYGRRNIFISSFVPYTIFQVAAALSPNITALTLFRFISGTFASSPMTTSGALISDIWGADQRGNAVALFTLAPFAGPALAPLISGFMEVTHTDWRWMFWTLAIFAGVCTAIIVIFVPETYAPYLCYQEAKRLRKETGDNRWHAALETGNESFHDFLRRTIYKPFIIIYEEPMLLALTLYLSFLYGLLYLLFEAVPLIFQGNHGLNPGVGGLVFLAFMMGGVFGVVLYVFYFNRKYERMHAAIAPKAVPPEARLEPMFYAAPTLVIVFFWMGWTSYKSISIVSPIIALFFFGPTIGLIFLSSVNYIVDAYLKNAASALAINTIGRSAFGAGFPMFAGQMFRKLGIPGAASLIAGIAMIFVPVPFLLAKYGKRIRMMSKNAVVLED